MNEKPESSIRAFPFPHPERRHTRLRPNKPAPSQRSNANYRQGIRIILIQAKKLVEHPQVFEIRIFNRTFFGSRPKVPPPNAAKSLSM